MQFFEEAGELFTWNSTASGQIHSENSNGQWTEVTFFGANVTDEHHGHLYAMSFGRAEDGDNKLEYIIVRNLTFRSNEHSLNFTGPKEAVARANQGEFKWFCRLNASIVHHGENDVRMYAFTNGTVMNQDNQTAQWTEFAVTDALQNGHFNTTTKGVLLPPKTGFDMSAMMLLPHFIRLDDRTPIAKWAISVDGDSSQNADGSSDWKAKNEGTVEVNGEKHTWTMDTTGKQYPPHPAVERLTKAFYQIPGL